MSLQGFIHSVSAADLLRLGAVALVLVLLQTAVYRLYFHPLASYPGPFWARLTTFPSWWHTYNLDRHIWLRRLHDEYGPAVRSTPGGVVLNTPDAFRALTGPKGNNTKSHAYKFFPRSADAQSTLQTIDNREHGRKRRVLANAFSERALRSYEPYVTASLARWVELFGAEIPEGSEWSPSLNMADWLNWLVFDIMGDLCFDKPMKMMDGGTKGRSELRRIIHLMGNMLQTFNHLANSPIAPLWVWLKPRGMDWLMRRFVPVDIKTWWAWLEDALADRLKEEEKARLDGQDESKAHKDFFHYLFQERDPVTGELGYSKEEYFEECNLLVTAGADTTAIVLAGIMFYLVRHPDVHARLTEEVRAAFDGAEAITPGRRLQSCEYLRAVINEGLRTTPPVGAELAREVLPGGAVIDDRFFPAGVTVSTSPFALGRNEDVFPEPSKFRPERWIVDKKTGVTEESVQRSERAIAAFSAGSRGCIGKNLGWMEMSLVLANLVYHFEMRRDPDNNLGGGDPVHGKPGRRGPDDYQIYDVFVALRDGPLVQLRKRVHS